MEGSLVVLMAVVVLVVVAVFPPIRSSKDRQRSQRLVAFAQSKGWHYDHERPELVDRFEGAPFVEGRSNARARHVLCTQMRGHRVLAFEYTYSFGRPGVRWRRCCTLTPWSLSPFPETHPWWRCAR